MRAIRPNKSGENRNRVLHESVGKPNIQWVGTRITRSKRDVPSKVEMLTYRCTTYDPGAIPSESNKLHTSISTHTLLRVCRLYEDCHSVSQHPPTVVKQNGLHISFPIFSLQTYDTEVLDVSIMGATLRID